MSAPQLAVHQLRYEQKSYWRNPPSAVFTFVFPIMFLVIFASLNSGSTISYLGGLDYNQYYLPGIMAFGVISACYTNLAMTMTIRRDLGILKRLRGTPLPTSAMIGGLALNALVITVIMSALLMTIGVLFYGVTFPGHWPALLVSLAVGAASFAAMGIAVSAFIRNADAAPAVVNGILFPILFVSGVFFPLEPGSTVYKIGQVFPVRHFVGALFTAFDPRLPHGPAHGFDWSAIGYVALWGAVAAVVALRTFRWEPPR